MFQQQQPDYYVLATGENHSMREFIELAFAQSDVASISRDQGNRRLGSMRPPNSTLLPSSALRSLSRSKGKHPPPRPNTSDARCYR